jgi:acetyl-CoA acetyltransferase
MALKEVVIVSGARTAIGKFMGTLKDVPARELAITAAKSAIERSGVPADQIDEICMGQLYTGNAGFLAGSSGQYARRLAALQQCCFRQPELYLWDARSGNRLP